MSVVRQRRRGTVPLLALLAAPFAQAAGAPSVPPDAADVPAGQAAAIVAPADAWWSDILAPLRQFGVESWYDVFRFAPWTGSVGFSFDEQQQRVTAPGAPTDRFSSQLFSETFTIRNDGFAVIDRSLLTGSLALGLTLEQERQRAIDAHTSQHGTLANYSLDATLLPETAYNVNMFAVRTQNTYVQASGSTTHSDIAYRGLAFHLRENSILREKQILPYFTANLQAQQQDDRQTTTSAGQTFRQDDRRDQLSFDFQNGTETSDLSFQYQFTRLDNFAYQPGSYDSHSANALYSIDFGRTLNWRSDSRLNYYTRAGRTPESDLTTLEASEFLTIDHNQDLSTNYNYQLTRQQTPFGNSMTQSAGAQVRQQIYGNLSLSGGVTGLHSALPGGTISAAGAAVNANYSHALPREGHLSASAGGSYLVTTSRVQAGVVQVTDAPYRVPDVVGAGSRILLADRNIETSTLVVVVVKDSTRVAAIVNIDYTVTVEGDRTYIVPLPGSAVMQPNDVLNVGYKYLVAADSKFRTSSRSASLGADWPWFGVSFGHDESDQTPLSGSSTLLVEERRDAGSVYLRGEWENWRARAGASLVRYDSTRLAYRERRLDQYVSYQPYLNLQFNVSANESRTDYQTPAHTTTTNGIRADVQWSWGAWITSGYAGWRAYTDTQQPSETIVEGGVRMRRNWTKLDLSVAAGVQQRTRGDVRSLNGIVHVGVARRF